MRSSMKAALYRDLFPQMLIFFYRNAILSMKLSHPSSFRAIRALIASQLTFEKETVACNSLFPYFLTLICISIYTNSGVF